MATPVTIEIRRGAVSALAPLLADGRISSGGDVAIAVGPGIGEAIADTLLGTLPRAPVHIVDGARLDNALELIVKLRAGFYDAVVGIGGGQTLDAAKYAASMLGLPFVSVATNLAHDGIASPVSVLESDGFKQSFGVHIPIAVIVDLDYVRMSPRRQLRAGIGDAVSNLSAVADWELAARHRFETVDGLAATLARTAAEAVIGRTDALTDDGFLTTLADGLLLSGLAMAVAGSSRPCSGACHEISHAIDALYPHTAMHGEQVAVGTLFAGFLRGDASIHAIDACFRRYGLPRVPADLGLTEDQFAAAVLRAPATRPDRFTILEHLSLDETRARERVDAFVQTFSR